MTVNSLVIWTCILLNLTGLAAADDRSLSTSSIIALSVLFGFILFVCLFCLVCFSVRKYKAIKRRKKRRNSSLRGTSNDSFVETQISATDFQPEEPQQNNNKKVDFQDTVDLVDEDGKLDVTLPLEVRGTEESENQFNGEIYSDENVSVTTGEAILIEGIIETSEEKPSISDKEDLAEPNYQESESGITSDINLENHLEKDRALGTDPDSQDHLDQEDQILNISPSDLENIVRVRLASARSDSVDVHIDDNDYIDGLFKIIGDNQDLNSTETKTELDTIVEQVPVQDIESRVESPKMVVQPNIVYTQTEQVNAYAQNGVAGPQLQRYTDWRNGNVTTTQSMYVKNTSNTMNKSQISDMRPRTRSISPNRYQQRTYERGRSVKRMVVPTQVVAQPYSSVRVQPVNRAKIIRSRSAPPIRQSQMTYVTRVPETTGYTRSHYLAIKQPFSKKFLLPPVKVSEKFVPVGSQRVVVTKRPTVIPRPMPQPRQEVIKGKVYHVQYNHQGANTITSGVNALNLERTASASTNNSGQMYYSTGYNGQYVTRLSSNSSQGVTGRAVYNTQHSYNSDVFDSAVQGTYARQAPTSNGYYITEQNRYSPYQYKVQQTQPTYYSQQNLIAMSDYTPKIMKTSFYQKRAQGWRFAENGTGSRPTSQVIEQVVPTSPRNGESDHIYSTVIKTTEKVEQNGKTDEFTIIDYVESGTSAGKTTSPLSTSTPRFPERDTSALEDLDNVLGKSGTSSSSSSSDEN